jgi:hypothetical protein
VVYGYAPFLDEWCAVFFTFLTVALVLGCFLHFCYEEAVAVVDVWVEALAFG